MDKNDEQHRAWLLLAENAARLAGACLWKHRDELSTITDEAIHDVKIKADQIAEKIIIDLLSPTGFSILSEEAGLLAARIESPLHWIVDPLDGTVNYLNGLPICCVSIALWENDNPVLGVVFDFFRDDIYKGLVGVGAWLNDVAISVRPRRPAIQSMLCTGFPVAMDFSQSTLEGFIRNIVSFKKVRLFGSAALSLAFVAAGRADAYYEKSIKLWDVAAGLALVKAAGGVIMVKKQVLEGVVDAYAGSSCLIEMQKS